MGDIVLKNVTLKIDQSVIVDGVSETVSDGELYGLIGPAGCGKTTLLKIIAGLAMADSGSLLVKGENVFHYSQKHMLDYHTVCGFVFQNAALVSNMSIYENLSLYYNYHTRKTDKEIYEIIKPYLDYVGFQDDLSVRPSLLSSGEKMLVGIVRAISHGPEFIFWDNPLAILDPAGQRRVKQIILDMKKKGKTMILVTNDYDFALSASDRVGIMDKGKILESGTPAEIRNSRLKTTRAVLAK